MGLVLHKNDALLFNLRKYRSMVIKMKSYRNSMNVIVGEFLKLSMNATIIGICLPEEGNLVVIIEGFFRVSVSI